MKALRRKDQPDTAAVEEARERFLDAYACEIPEALAGLLETVLPAYAQDTPPPVYNLWSAVLYTHPALADTLSTWAERFRLTFDGKPAGWAVDTALETLRTWRDSIRYPLVCLQWHHLPAARETFPSGDPEFFSALSGESEASEVARAFSVQFAIPRWDLANGETESHFRARFNAECSRIRAEHIKKSKEWTERRAIQEPRYVEGLAMWQAGRKLSDIHKALEDRGLNVGRPGDSDFNSAISKGLDRMAKLIQLDRRPRS